MTDLAALEQRADRAAQAWRNKVGAEDLGTLLASFASNEIAALRAPSPDTRVREALIEECAKRLEDSYPGHAWLNAACAAIRSMTALTQPGAVEPDNLPDVNDGDDHYWSKNRSKDSMFAKSPALDHGTVEALAYRKVDDFSFEILRGSDEIIIAYVYSEEMAKRIILALIGQPARNAGHVVSSTSRAGGER